MNGTQAESTLIYAFDAIGGTLSSCTSGGGEVDAWKHLPLKTRQRLTGAGLVRKAGMPVDVATEAWNDRFGTDLDCDGFINAWSTLALVALDAKRDARVGIIPESERERPDPDPLPASTQAYIDRLVYEPKKLFAIAFAEALWNGEPEPEIPETNWAADVVRKLTNRYCASRGV